jgi:hypothetical protein
MNIHYSVNQLQLIITIKDDVMRSFQVNFRPPLGHTLLFPPRLGYTKMYCKVA